MFKNLHRKALNFYAVSCPKKKVRVRFDGAWEVLSLPSWRRGRD
jgi:hypothetical protein